MVDCGYMYSLELPQLGGSNIYAQSVFRGKIKEKTTHQKYGRYKEHSRLLKTNLIQYKFLPLFVVIV